MNNLILFVAALVTSMPFNSKICKEPGIYFHIRECTRDQSYFANILLTLEEKPLKEDSSETVVRISVAHPFDLPSTKVITISAKTIDFQEKSLQIESKDKIPFVVTSSRHISRKSDHARQIEKRVLALIRTVRDSKLDKSGRDHSMCEDATSVLIEAVGRDSSGYVHVVTDDDESLLFRQAETLEFDYSEKRSLFD